MMYANLDANILGKDRIFGNIDKEYIYYRDKGLCQKPGCGHRVEWPDAEFHHVEPYAGGGKTMAANGALVHKMCHPKTKVDVDAFAKLWRARK
jgi:hypothetical protein